MTKLEFEAICGELLIDVGVALEDYDIQNLLIDRVTPEEMKKYMERNF
jgi:hypothetical protein